MAPTEPYHIEWNCLSSKAKFSEHQRLKNKLSGADGWQKVEFSFFDSKRQRGIGPYKRCFEVKKVELNTGEQSFQIREASLIKRLIPDFLFKSKYRIELDSVFDVDDSKSVKTGGELPTKTTNIALSEWKKGGVNYSGIGEDKRPSDSNLQKKTTLDIESQDQDLIANYQVTNVKATVQVPIEFKISGERTLKMKAVSSIADVKEAIPRQEKPPLLVFDIDQTLVHKTRANGNAVTASEAVEHDINKHLQQLRDRFPDAHMIIVSNGSFITDKLKFAGITTKFNKCIEPELDSENNKKRLNKGEVIKQYMEDNGLCDHEVVFIDDAADVHNEVANGLPENIVHHFLFLGATEERTFFLSKNDYHGDEHKLFNDDEHALFCHNLNNSMNRIKKELEASRDKEIRRRRVKFKRAHQKFLNQLAKPSEEFYQSYKRPYRHFYRI
ncbi:hypothetical protein SOPP22_11210 [Shewanella sp. OPT22]|nr:hypothetical protein SOPP22_11210 [Shewanella sp. OPT22]